MYVSRLVIPDLCRCASFRRLWGVAGQVVYRVAGSCGTGDETRGRPHARAHACALRAGRLPRCSRNALVDRGEMRGEWNHDVYLGRRILTSVSPGNSIPYTPRQTRGAVSLGDPRKPEAPLRVPPEFVGGGSWSCPKHRVFPTQP
jgi:hypothetical protein